MSLLAQRPPAISGVSSSHEAQIQTIYPSIACTGIGKLLGKLYNCIPIPLGDLKVSHLIFPLPSAPLVVLIYFWLKVFGQVYLLTNRSVRIKSAVGPTLYQKVPLADIADVVVEQQQGQEFFPAADLRLLGKKGETLAVLGGVPWADVFRQSILDARDARVQTEASLATIRARKK